MAFIKDSNGNHFEWDEHLTVGTLIRTYYSGYWILERIEFRDPDPRAPGLKDSIFDIWPIEWSHDDMKNTPIFHFCQVLNDRGEPTKKNRKSCDASYCRRINLEYVEIQAAAEHALAASKAVAIAQFL